MARQTIFEGLESKEYHPRTVCRALARLTRFQDFTMHVFSTSRTLLLACLACFGMAAQAQELQLFEPVETPAQGAEPGQTLAEDSAQIAMPTAPAFTLVGTSRIGGRQTATLLSSTGEIVKVALSEDGDQPIDGYPGYRLVRVSSRQAAISLPEGMPCLGSRSQGVSCGADGLVALSLTMAAPVPVAEPAVQTDGQPVVAEVTENGDVPPDNPFAAALRAAAQNERAGNAAGQRGGPFNAERFQPRRIAPEDVPPGMRVVRTPFGDRLVEQ